MEQSISLPLKGRRSYWDEALGEAFGEGVKAV